MGKNKPKAKGRRPSWTRSLLRSACFVFCLLTIRVVALQGFTITSGSMEPTLLVGDFVWANKAAMGSRIPFTDIRIPGYSDPRRGDILVFDPPHSDSLILVKRVVGLPGDTLAMRAGILYRSDHPQVEPYVVVKGLPDNFSPPMLWQRSILVGGPRADYAPTRDNWGPLVIPEGHYFMMGDNRDDSLDSRTWGLVERWRFEGWVVFRYFSYNRDSHRPFPFIREIRWSRIGTRPR
ncbi:MAG: signal peptidase I [Gammaproteobacteria bacterium]|nr:signal peptidase I [Gammaproteobacteria bacterium]